MELIKLVYASKFFETLLAIEAQYCDLLENWPTLADVTYNINSLADLPKTAPILIVLEALRSEMIGDGNVALLWGITSNWLADQVFGQISEEVEKETKGWEGHLWTDGYLFRATWMDLKLELKDEVVVPEALWRRELERLERVEMSGDPILDNSSSLPYISEDEDLHSVSRHAHILLSIHPCLLSEVRADPYLQVPR